MKQLGTASVFGWPKDERRRLRKVPRIRTERDDWHKLLCFMTHSSHCRQALCISTYGLLMFSLANESVKTWTASKRTAETIRGNDRIYFINKPVTLCPSLSHESFLLFIIAQQNQTR